MYYFIISKQFKTTMCKYWVFIPLDPPTNVWYFGEQQIEAFLTKCKKYFTNETVHNNVIIMIFYL